MSRYAYRLRRPEITRRLAPARVVAPKAKPKAVVVQPKPDYSTYIKADLISLAQKRGLDTSGTKADLIKRLS